MDGDCDGTDWLGGAYGDYCVIDGDPADDLVRNPETVSVDGDQAHSNPLLNPPVIIIDDGTLVNGTSVNVNASADQLNLTYIAFVPPTSAQAASNVNKNYPLTTPYAPTQSQVMGAVEGNFSPVWKLLCGAI